MVHRSFDLQPGRRQNAEVIGIQLIGTKTKCAAYCTQRFYFCVGFNFLPGHPGKCELCRIPYDAPNADMVADPAWNHYAIIPWMADLFFILLNYSLVCWPQTLWLRVSFQRRNWVFCSIQEYLNINTNLSIIYVSMLWLCDDVDNSFPPQCANA